MALQEPFVIILAYRIKKIIRGDKRLTLFVRISNKQIAPMELQKKKSRFFTIRWLLRINPK